MPSHLEDAATVDLGFARIDLTRKHRCGFPEVIYAEGKAVDGLIQIVSTLHTAGQGCLATRVNEAQSAALLSTFPHAVQERIGRTFWLPSSNQPSPPTGNIIVVTAGTADLPVAHEALATAQAMGINTELIADVGVAGLHRLLAQLDRLRQADVLIVVAGMEGALPSVVAGLVSVPVIAVPTSVGYGASYQGIAALLGMLNSCASGVAVVNIDNGFGAACIASKINHL